jgi:alanine dehydrogenase
VLILNGADVEAVLDRDALTDAVGSALAETSAGWASLPPRVAAETGAGLLLAMPGAFTRLGGLGAKLVSLFPGNVERPTHQAVILLFDPDTGTPTALVDGTLITAARTAAASAVATRYLARADSEVMAILGTGVQARAHALAVPRVAPAVREIRIAGRNPDASAIVALDFAEALQRAGMSHIAVTAAATFADALAGADIVCATTPATEPIVRREWLSPGVHVNSVGFSDGREVDAQTVLDALVVVESRSSALAPMPAGANELLWPIRDGLMEPTHVHAEIGELVAGTRPGRTAPEQITLYKGVGVAVEDLAAAMLVVAAARAQGVGATVDLEPEHRESRGK